MNRILFGGKSRSHIQASLTDQGIPREKGSLDEFLLERYRFWASRNHKKSTTAIVKHKPMSLKEWKTRNTEGIYLSQQVLGSRKVGQSYHTIVRDSQLKHPHHLGSLWRAKKTKHE